VFRKEEGGKGLKALIIYHTKTGHTLEAARDIARGLEAEGIECDILEANRLEKVKISDYDILVVGSPTYGTRGYRLPAREVQRFLDSLASGALKGKVCGAFTVNAGVGGRMLESAMEMKLLKLGGKVIQSGPVVKAGAPLSLWKGPSASEVDRKKCEEFGRNLAKAAKQGK